MHPGMGEEKVGQGATEYPDREDSVLQVGNGNSTLQRCGNQSMSGTHAMAGVSSLGLLEPKAVPAVQKALLELLIIFSVIIALALVVTVSSIVGIIRAVGRRRRGGHSVAAVVLAAIANAITACWLLYWVSDDIYHKSNPINGLLAINGAVCVLPLSWLIASIRANAKLHD